MARRADRVHAAESAFVGRRWRSSLSVAGAFVACAVATGLLLGGCFLGRERLSGPQARAADDNSMGSFEYGRGELSNAEAFFTSGLETSRSIDDEKGQAVALLNLSRVDAQRWRFDRALARAHDAEELAGSDPSLRGAVLAQLAALEARTGQHDSAVTRAREALGLVDRLDLRRRDADRLRGDRNTTLAFALIHAGGNQCGEAEQALAAANEAYGRRIDLAAEAAIAQLRGILALGRRDADTAGDQLRKALQLDRERGRPLDVADDLEALATAADLGGEADQVGVWLSRALAVREAVDSPRRALATAERLSSVRPSPELEGRIALLRAEVGDHHPQPPTPPRPCG